MKTTKMLMGMLLFAVLFSGCSKIQDLANPLVGNNQAVVICARAVVNQAYELFDEAKMELARHYDNRDANHLLQAYYAAADSMTLARSVAKCPDRTNGDFFAMRNLLDLNRSLQRVVRLNMRDDDPSNLIALYRDQYYKVMPNDIK